MDESANMKDAPTVPKRARRRHDAASVKARMRFLGQHIWQIGDRWLTEKWLGNMAG